LLREPNTAIARLIPKTRELKVGSAYGNGFYESGDSKVNPENKGTERSDSVYRTRITTG